MKPKNPHILMCGGATGATQSHGLCSAVNKNVEKQRFFGRCASSE